MRRLYRSDSCHHSRGVSHVRSSKSFYKLVKFALVSGLLLLMPSCVTARNRPSNESPQRISMPTASLAVPAHYTWKRQEFGEGGLQEARLPGGQIIKLKRQQATNLSTIIDQGSLHSLQVYVMEFVSPEPLPDADELVAAFAAQPFTAIGMTPLQEDRGSIIYAKAHCSRVSGKVEVKGSEKFKNVLFDFQVTQLDCLPPNTSDRMIRLSVSERAKKGTEFVGDSLEQAIASSLEFH